MEGSKGRKDAIILLGKKILIISVLLNLLCVWITFRTVVVILVSEKTHTHTKKKKKGEIQAIRFQRPVGK